MLARIGVKPLHRTWLTLGERLQQIIQWLRSSARSALRDELLNGEIFYSLSEASIIIEAWRRHYSTTWPHCALRYSPPAPEAVSSAEPASTRLWFRPDALLSQECKWLHKGWLRYRGLVMTARGYPATLAEDVTYTYVNSAPGVHRLGLTGIADESGTSSLA